MSKDWQELSKITGDREICINRVRLVKEDIAIEGDFELPPLARLSSDDQIFVAAFVRCHGSIKQMEKYFGVSYPTIKNRLNRISDLLEFVEIEPAPSGSDVIDRLERGEITVDQALNELHKGESHV